MNAGLRTKRSCQSRVLRMHQRTRPLSLLRARWSSKSFVTARWDRKPVDSILGLEKQSSAISLSSPSSQYE